MRGEVVYGLIVGALIFIPLERIFALHRTQKIFRRAWLTDIAHFLFTRTLANIATIVFVGAAILLLHSLVSPHFQAAVASQSRVLQFLEALLIANIGAYVGHRLEHQIPFLWRFHSVHHSIAEMDWLAAARLHPLDQVVTKVLTIVPLYLLGFSKATFGAYLGLATFHAVLIHANVRFKFGPLRWLITSPQFHHWHHSNDPQAHNKNFAGELPVLDLLFGTFYLPGNNMPTEYGVSERVPAKYFRQIIYPFTRRTASDKW
jgi:sterol desaturase/sphingolipid hydroxylase (fatty acid hydroxylase superfamily)